MTNRLNRICRKCGWFCPGSHFAAVWALLCYYEWKSWPQFDLSCATLPIQGLR